MENVIHYLTLDLTGPDMCPMIEVQRGDSARTLIISLTQGGRPYRIAEGLTAALYATKPDGNPLFNACTIEKNQIRYDFTPQTANVLGVFDCEIWLVSGDKRELTTPKFSIAVDERMRTDDVIPESEPEYTAITEMVAAGTAMIEELREALAGLEGVEEILPQARAAAEAASNSEAAAKGHAKTAAKAAEDALTLAGQANSASQQSNKYAYEALQHRQAAEAAAKRAEEAAANPGQGDGSGSAQNPPQDGEDGFSPIATVTQTAEGATISITDKNGTTTATVTNGKDGDDGYTPQKGVDYFDGQPGKDGYTPVKGKDYTDGADGVSPTVAVSAITGGHRISITDKSGTKTVDVMDGEDGNPGDPGRGIKSITRTSGNGAAGTTDTYTIAYTDNTTSTFTVRNGSNGAAGKAATIEITGATALAYGATPTVTEQSDSTDQTRKYELGIPAGKPGADYSFDPTVYGLPVLWLTGDTAPIAVSKDNKVTMSYTHGERSGTAKLKGQGATSYKTAQALVNAGKAGKFNYTITFDEAFEAFPGWGAQKKYCLKANFIDPTQSRNVCSCKQWGMIVKSRSKVPTEMANLPNGGAIDGFPIIIMLNGEFHGLYTWNIPKDGWMFGMVESTTKQQAIVAAKDHTAATQFKEASMSGYEVEFVSDEDNADWVQTSLTRMIAAVMNSNGSDLDTTVAQYLDWDSAIDYYAHIVADKATDCVDKNFLLVTFDGIKWYFSDYDRDSIHGLNWDASGTTRPVSNVTFQECAESVRVFELIYRFKTDKFKARCNELLANILSESRTMQIFENFAWAIPLPVMVEDVKRYPTILGSGVNTIDQIGRFVRQRREVMVKWLNALPAQETPVEPEPPVVMVNQVPISTDTDGSIYNGTGYKDNARLSSSGGVSGTAQDGSVVTGFIPYTSGGVIRMTGAEWLGMTDAHGGHYYLSFYKSDKTIIPGNGYVPADGYKGGTYGTWITYDAATGITTFDTTGALTATSGFLLAIKDAAYFRLNAYGKGADLIVTVNQEITE